MCGIAGIVAFSPKGQNQLDRITPATKRLQHRGPDHQAVFRHSSVALGHARLSIIDTSAAANQPMTDGRYVISFNGEIYNFKSIRQSLEAEGVVFTTRSDTEVLLQAYKKWGAAALDQLNGFFAVAIYDKETEKLFLARDRIGIKPLYYYRDEDQLIFASEIKAILAFDIDKSLDHESLYQYLQLTYIPSPNSIFKRIKKLLPGSLMDIQSQEIRTSRWYELPAPNPEAYNKLSFSGQQERFRQLLETSVQQRMIADVPLGTFLSGGIDSSVITGIAARYTDKLSTFSIGFRDEPFYDETHYAELVAKKFGTDHTVFRLSNADLFDHLFDMLDTIDEPFADSSALAVYILSKHTRESVKVALSGDGADELFAGYHKHYAEYKVRLGGLGKALVSGLAPVWQALPKSRGSSIGNMVRQLHRFSTIARMGWEERYWHLCTFMPAGQAARLMDIAHNPEIDDQRKQDILEAHTDDYNWFLHRDVRLVLENDMLVKVDRMSMASSLEVRVPFLDHHLAAFAFDLPASSKINGRLKKRILQESYREMLPDALFNRPKQGFEVPLLPWFRKELQSLIEEDLLADKWIEEQGIFNIEAVRSLKQQINSSDPGDVHFHIWTLLVFQYWWKKYFN